MNSDNSVAFLQIDFEAICSQSANFEDGLVLGVVELEGADRTVSGVINNLEGLDLSPVEHLKAIVSCFGSFIAREHLEGKPPTSIDVLDLGDGVVIADLLGEDVVDMVAWIERVVIG